MTAGFGPSSNVSAIALADGVWRTVGPNNSADGPTAPQVAMPAAALAGKMYAQGFNFSSPMLLILARPRPLEKLCYWETRVGERITVRRLNTSKM